jgi:hypothetical protein
MCSFAAASNFEYSEQKAKRYAGGKAVRDAIEKGRHKSRHRRKTGGPRFR